jgi:hypothetical protein
MLIQTFVSEIGGSYTVNREAMEFIERQKKDYKYIDIKTTSNEYYFYMTVILEKR